MIRVLVVDDSLTARKWICELVQSHPGIEVIREAMDGTQAVVLTEQLRPDVIIMDMAMPLSNGVEATRQIMARFPTPIVVLSSAENRPSCLDVVAALRAGAVEAIEKPGEMTDRKQWTQDFLHTIRIVSRVRVIRHISASLPARRPRRSVPRHAELVVIGASTGGPAMVSSILATLPPLPIPVLVVVHFPETLFEHFVEWLDADSRMPVVMARNGASLRSLAGTVSVAVPDRHLIVSGGRIAMTDAPPEHFCKPAVDVLFHSVAASVGERAVAVLLTGMGSDGAAGMLQIRNSGGRTIAQDEATSAIFGMPKVAIEMNAVDEVLPGPEIADAIFRLCGKAKCEVSP